MRTMIISLLGLMILFNACQKKVQEVDEPGTEQFKEITFYTSDSIKIYGDLYEFDKSGPTILLFHQGGSNARAEYGSIIPKLTEAGFNVLAIDQRVGGQIYGNYNRTLAEISDHSFDNPYGYCDAYNNLEATMEFAIAQGFGGNLIAWGSSYSAALAVQLAHKNPESIDAVLAFSPASGGSMTDCLASPYLETLEVPLLLLRPPNEMESESVRAQFALAQQFGHQTFAAPYGIHGSSMLVQDRVNNDVSGTWNVVFSFLDQVK